MMCKRASSFLVRLLQLVEPGRIPWGMRAGKDENSSRHARASSLLPAERFVLANDRPECSGKDEDASPRRDPL